MNESKSKLSRWLGWIVAILILAFNLFILANKNEQIERAEHNYEVSISEMQYALDSTVAVRDLYLLERDEAIDQLGLSKKENKKLEKELKSKMNIIAHISSQIKLDTIYINDTVIVENSAGFVRFRAMNKWYEIEADCNLEEMCINKLNMNVPLVTGLAGNKIWIRSDNPYVKFSSIEGAIIDPPVRYKQKRIGFGFQIGVGCQYGIINKRFDLGPQIGFGLQINL